ncbi:Ferritin-like protein [Hydrogenophaga sp. T4]|nr:Ferritin-like protein [Hydrogenophaga sp. T4]
MRDFADAYVELIRLLREASEVEHALMAQYLYGAFSLKPAYASIAGYGSPNSNDLLGVAIQEMQHLGQVNALLMALDASPHLIRQDFPYQPDIYPFEFNLEPLTQVSLAKYVYTEAPVNGLKRSKVSSPAETQFLDQLDRVLGGSTRPNHVGSLYDRIIQTLQEYIRTTPKRSAELKPWIAKLEEIKREGEDNHFLFFKSLFLGTHEGFKGHKNIWSLAPNDPAYPSLPLAINPSAFVGHPNQIKDPLALSLAWLGNLHYWTILLLTDAAYSDADHTYIDLAKQQMMGPFLSLARHLPTLGVGMPCEPLSTGYAPCRTTAARLRFVSSMVGESNQLAQQLKDRLPADYPLAVGEAMMSTLTEKRAQYA